MAKKNPFKTARFYVISIVLGIILSFILVDGTFCFDTCGYVFVIPLIWSPLFIVIVAISYLLIVSKKRLWWIIPSVLLLFLVANFFIEFSTFGITKFKDKSQGTFGITDPSDDFIGSACDGVSLGRIRGTIKDFNTDCFTIKRICTETCLEMGICNGVYQCCTIESSCEDIKI